VLLVVAAAGLRFRDLGGEPLGALEAASTWPAWIAATAHGESPPPPGAPPASALLFAGQWALFWLTGSGSDALARAWPATLGTALVLVPWLMRPVIGGRATLALSGLLAVEPVLVGTSRLADGVSASALAALLVVACLVRARAATGEGGAERARTRWLGASAVSLGCLVVSGPAAWSLLLVLGLADAGGWLGVTPGPAGGHPAPARGPAGRLLGTAATSAVLAATAGLTQLQGLPAVGTSLAAWLAQWDDLPGLPGLAGLRERILVEQPLTLGLGMLGLVAAWRQAGTAPPRRRWALLATGGLAVASAWAGRATIVGRLPLTLLLVLAGAGLARDLPFRLLLGALRGAHLAGAAVALSALVLGLITLRSAFWPPSRWEATQPGARRLAADAATLCAWQVGDARECPVQVVGDRWPDPLLAWHLRELDRLRWRPGPPSPAGDRDRKPLIITAAPLVDRQLAALAARLPAGYAGSRYRIRIGSAGPLDVILWEPPAGSAPGPPAGPPPSEPEP
jgi:hypothetical protein